MSIPVLQRARKSWNPASVTPPQVDPELDGMNATQRATESWRYVLLRWEHWVASDGTVREWLRHNTRIGAWLLVPAIFVMPVVGLILWQVTGWLAMLMSIAGRLIVLPVLIFVAFVVIRITVAFLKR